MASVKNRNTFRASGIDIRTRGSEFRRELYRYCTAEEERDIRFSRLKFAPSFADGGRTQVAFITFYPRTPSFLLLHDEDGKPTNIPLPTFLMKIQGRTICIDPNFFGLTQLYPTKGEVTADIVALTGVNGHAFGSWTNQAGDMWLQDWLPDNPDLRHCRTLIFGYNAKFGESAEHDMEDYVQSLLDDLIIARREVEQTNKPRPIIFIGHSYGGVVIKQALSTASLPMEPKYHPIYQSTVKLIFFGVPHRDISFEDVQKMVDGTPVEQQGHHIVANLKYETRNRADRKHFTYAVAMRKISLVSFYERLKTKRVERQENGDFKRTGLPTMVVDRESAVLGLLELEEAYPVDADHSEIVKFPHDSYQTYTTVVDHLKTAIKTGIQPQITTIHGAAPGAETRVQPQLSQIISREQYSHLMGQCLRLAVEYGSAEGVLRCLEHGADPNFQNSTVIDDETLWPNIFNDSFFPQSDADREYAQKELARFLQTVETPLALAVRRDKKIIVQLLLRARADPNLECTPLSPGSTPLREACIYNHDNSLQLLLEYGADPNTKHPTWGTTALHEAAGRNNHRLVSRLAHYDVDLNAASEINGDTPMHVAAKKGYFRMVAELLKEGADATIKNTEGCTALHYAARTRSKDAAEEQFITGTSVNGSVKGSVRGSVKGTAKDTPDKATMIFRSLLYYGADKAVNIVDKRNNTPLHDAAKAGLPEVVEILLESGADPNAPNKFRRTAADIARKETSADHKRVVNILEASQARKRTVAS